MGKHSPFAGDSDFFKILLEHLITRSFSETGSIHIQDHGPVCASHRSFYSTKYIRLPDLFSEHPLIRGEGYYQKVINE